MGCTVCILPYIIGCAVQCHRLYPLIEVGSPSIAQGEIITCRAVGIIDMVNAHRHPVAAEAHIIANPYKVAGVVVDVSGPCPSRAHGGVGIVILQAYIAAVGDGQNGGIIITIGVESNTAELIQCQLGFILCDNGNGGIAAFKIPALCGIRQIPGTVSQCGCAGHIIVGIGGVILGLISPCDCLEPCPVVAVSTWQGGRHIVGCNRNFIQCVTGELKKVHIQCRVCDDRPGRNRRQIVKVYKQSVQALQILRLIGHVAYIERLPVHCRTVRCRFHSKRRKDIFVGRSGIQFQSRVYTNRKHPLLRIDPIFIRGYCQYNTAGNLRKCKTDIGRNLAFAIFHIRSRNGVNTSFILICKRNGTVFIQFST